MKTQKLEPKTLESTWMIHVYGRDRKLLCALDPSHGWALLAGVGMGIFAVMGLVAIGSNVEPSSPTVQETTPDETHLVAPFGID